MVTECILYEVQTDI